jgi:hypothetical protein
MFVSKFSYRIKVARYELACEVELFRWSGGSPGLQSDQRGVEEFMVSNAVLLRWSGGSPDLQSCGKTIHCNTGKNVNTCEARYCIVA